MRLLSVGAVLLLAGACGIGGSDPSNSASDQGNDMSPIVPRGVGPRAHTMYVNFDGALISPALLGDARRNVSDIISNPATVPAFDPARFGGDSAAAREGIVTILQQLFAAYDMQVVTTRPPEDEPYVMVMVGGGASDLALPDSARGFAPLDCEDSNGWDVVFVFARALGLDFDAPADAQRAVAQVAAQESAHSYGLVHTDNDVDVMYPYVQFPVRSQRFDQGLIVGKGCGQTGWQDSAGILMQLLGPRP